MAPVQYQINDIVELKKPHPCGNKLWIITRTGIDFGLKCQKCGHRVMIPRKTFERAVKRVVTPEKIRGRKRYALNTIRGNASTTKKEESAWQQSGS